MGWPRIRKPCAPFTSVLFFLKVLIMLVFPKVGDVVEIDSAEFTVLSVDTPFEASAVVADADGRAFPINLREISRICG